MISDFCTKKCPLLLLFFFFSLNGAMTVLETWKHEKEARKSCHSSLSCHTQVVSSLAVCFLLPESCRS